MNEGVEWFSLVEITQRVGRLVWVEQRLGDVFGSWSKHEPRPRFRILLAEAGAHHEWHGQMLRSCLPTSPQLAAEQEVVAPSDQWLTVSGLLDSFVDDEDSEIRLQALQREIYPWLAREVDSLSAVGSDVSDRHMARWLRFISLDHDGHEHEITMMTADDRSQPTRMSDRAMLAQLSLTEPPPS